jgi:hypothetical protein
MMLLLLRVARAAMFGAAKVCNAPNIIDVFSSSMIASMLSILCGERRESTID